MSRRRRNTIFASCLLLVAAVIWLDHSPIKRKWQRQPQSEERLISCDLQKYHKKSFTVVNVVDGDTLDIDIPDGEYNHTRIRLWGIDTPETKSPQGSAAYFSSQAADFAEKLVLGKRVTIYLDENRTRGKYGRLLAYVQLPGRTFLNEVLISEGFAYADLRFEHNFFYKYAQLEAAARSARKGLWEGVTRGQLPQWLQRKKPSLLAGREKK